MLGHRDHGARQCTMRRATSLAQPTLAETWLRSRRLFYSWVLKNVIHEMSPCVLMLRVVMFGLTTVMRARRAFVFCAHVCAAPVSHVSTHKRTTLYSSSLPTQVRKNIATLTCVPRSYDELRCVGRHHLTFGLTTSSSPFLTSRESTKHGILMVKLLILRST